MKHNIDLILSVNEVYHRTITETLTEINDELDSQPDIILADPETVETVSRLVRARMACETALKQLEEQHTEFSSVL